MKYRIRDLFWLILSAGLGMGWFVDRHAYRKANSDWVDFDYQYFETASSEIGPRQAPFDRTPHAFEDEIALGPDAD